jgi:hypothetical protein
MKRMPKDPDMLEEYDFSKGIRGKYAKRYAEGTNVVVIDPDVAKIFPDHDSVTLALRPSTEERYRQLKCFNDLTHFTSRDFSMVTNQVVFIMLAYDLLQIYLLRQGRKELNQKTLPRIRQQLFPSDN